MRTWELMYEGRHRTISTCRHLTQSIQIKWSSTISTSIPWIISLIFLQAVVRHDIEGMAVISESTTLHQRRYHSPHKIIHGVGIKSSLLRYLNSWHVAVTKPFQRHKFRLSAL